MSSVTLRWMRTESVRNTLVHLFGWRALVWQQDPAAWDRFRWLRRWVQHAPLRTLDAGSGSGSFSLFAASRGHTVLGLSLDHQANARATQRAALLGLDQARFETADLREIGRLAGGLGSFDQIFCLETLEHVENDARLMADLAALLRRGGTLFVTAPSAYHRALVGERLSTSEDGGHVRWGYSMDSMRLLFHHAGLRVASEAYLSGIVTQQITNASRLFARVIGERAAWATTLPLRLLRIADRPLTRLLRYPWLAVAMMGVKP